MPALLALSRLAPFDPRTGDLVVVVETPRGSRNKYAYHPETGGFELRHVLPEGLHFPFDFGFIPSTRAGDGDPLDAILLLDAPAHPGVIVPSRLLGVIEAEQERDDVRERNDRLVAVAEASHLHRHVAGLDDLSPTFLDEAEAFFTHYNRLRGQAFRPLARRGAGAARASIDRARAGPGG